MEPVSCRYGEDVTLPVDTGDLTALSADIYVGKPGEAYKFTAHTVLVNGAGTFLIPGSDTRLPLDTYFYQVNVNHASGGPDKYPSPEGDCDGCDGDFPEFVIAEALDESEVIS